MYRPVSMDNVVVFPAPLCPRRAVMWSLYMLREMFSTATLGFFGCEGGEGGEGGEGVVRV